MSMAIVSKALQHRAMPSTVDDDGKLRVRVFRVGGRDLFVYRYYGEFVASFDWYSLGCKMDCWGSYKPMPHTLLMRWHLGQEVHP
jgi:hypothetical protein